MGGIKNDTLDIMHRGEKSSLPIRAYHDDLIFPKNGDSILPKGGDTIFPKSGELIVPIYGEWIFPFNGGDGRSGDTAGM